MRELQRHKYKSAGCGSWYGRLWVLVWTYIKRNKGLHEVNCSAFKIGRDGKVALNGKQWQASDSYSSGKKGT